jgi:hypothetical protein
MWYQHSKKLIVVLLVHAVYFYSSVFFQQKNCQLPNVILIIADDLGYSDLLLWEYSYSYPNIDGLGNGGVVFHRHM